MIIIFVKKRLCVCKLLLFEGSEYKTQLHIYYSFRGISIGSIFSPINRNNYRTTIQTVARTETVAFSLTTWSGARKRIGIVATTVILSTIIASVTMISKWSKPRSRCPATEVTVPVGDDENGDDCETCKYYYDYYCYYLCVCACVLACVRVCVCVSVARPASQTCAITRRTVASR